MRKWVELKQWEKEYIKKKSLIMAAIILLLIIVAVTTFLVVRNNPATVPEELREYPWQDSFTGMYFKVVGNITKETQLSDDVSLVGVDIVYKDGTQGQRELVWWKSQEPEMWYYVPIEESCMVGARVSQYKQEGDEYVPYTSDFFILYRIGYEDGEVVFCVVSADADVRDTVGSELFQMKHDDLYYSYFLVNQIKPGYSVYYKNNQVSFDDYPFTYCAPKSIYQEYVEWVKSYQKNSQSGRFSD